MKRIYSILALLFLHAAAFAQNTLDKAGLTAATPAAGAYALRKLSSSYTGYAITVRRSSDNTTSNIGFNGDGNLDTTTLKTFCGSSSGYVTIWFDQSGNGANATQSSVGNQAMIFASGVVVKQNNRPAVSFNGSDFYVATMATLSATTAHSLNGVGQGAGTIVTLSGSSAANQNSCLGAANTNNGYVGPWFGGWSQDGAYIASANASNTTNIETKTFSTDSVVGYLNGSNVFINTATTYSLTTANIVIGSQNTIGNAQVLVGNISETIVFLKALSSAVRAALEQNQFSYYGANTGGQTVCNGGTITLANPITGGTWTVSNSNATINSATGALTAVSHGTTVVSYTIPSAYTATTTVTISSTTASITGNVNIAASGTSTLSVGSVAGAWSSNNTAIATIGSSTGIASGVAVGTAVISFLATAGCISTASVNVIYPLNNAGLTTSTPALAAYALRKLSSAYSGPAINVVRSSDDSAKDISFDAHGNLDTVTLKTFCGSNNGYIATWYDQTGNGHNAVQGTISNQAQIVTSGIVNRYNSWPAVSYNGNNVYVASLGALNTNAPHTLNGVGQGSGDMITLSGQEINNENSCLGAGMTNAGGSIGPWYGGWGQDAAYIATANSNPGLNIETKTFASGTVTGYINGTGCFTNTATTYTLTASNILLGSQTSAPYGQNLVGVQQESILFLSSIATATRTTLESNQMNYYGAITGAQSVCKGGTITLSDIFTGGTWSSSNTGIATIGASTGIVNAVASGTVTMTYTMATGVAATATLSVSGTSAAITGALTEPYGATTTLSSGATGGTWVSSATGIATIVPTTGAVTGIAGGVTMITYTASTGCITTRTLTITNTLDLIGLTSSTPVTAAYSVRKLTSGNVPYAITVRRSSDNTSTNIGFNSSGNLDTTTLKTFCGGSNGYVTTWYDQTGNGNNAVQAITGSQATVINSGATVLYNGIPSVQYPAGNSYYVATIASLSPTSPFTMNSVGQGSGTLVTLSGSSVGNQNSCLGAANTSASGIVGPWYGGWSEDGSYIVSGYSNNSMDVLTKTYSSGIINGYANGVNIFSTTGTYSLTTSNIVLGSQVTAGTAQELTGYQSESVVLLNTVSNAVRSAVECNQFNYYGKISGNTSLCSGTTTTLTDAFASGTWHSSNTSVAGIGASTGLLSAVAPGTAIVTYSVTGGCSVSATVTVSPQPVIASVSTPTICIGAVTAPLTYTISGSPSIYSILWNAAALSAGFTNITSATGFPASSYNLPVGSSVSSGTNYNGRLTVYSASGVCSASQNISVAVVAAPVPAAISASVGTLCAGASVVLNAGTPTGGSGSIASYSWSATDPTGATTAMGSSAAGTLTVTPGSAGPGNYTYTITTSMTGAGCTATATKSLSVVDQPTVTVSTSSNNICTGSALTLSATLLSGAGSANYSWSGPIATDHSSFSQTGTLPAGVTSLVAVYTPSATSSGSYSLSVIYPAATGCGVATAVTSSVIYTTPPSIALNAVSPICQGASMDYLTYSSTTGVPSNYNINWSSAALSAGFANVADGLLIPSHIGIALPSGVAPGNYTGAITMLNSATCSSAPATSFTVNIAGIPTARIASAPAPCMGYSMAVTFAATPLSVITYSTVASTYTATVSALGNYVQAIGALVAPMNLELISVSNGYCSSTIDTGITIVPNIQQWIGVADTNWHNAANWGCGFVPVANNDVTIPTGTPFILSMTGTDTGSVRNLTIADGANIKMDGGSRLHILADLYNNGFVTGTGSAMFTGTVPQNIHGVGNMTNVLINNPSGVSIASASDSLYLNGTLQIAAGNFYTNGSLTVVVDSNGTSGNIGTITGGGISGNVIMKQWIRSGRRAYRFWGHPFTNKIALSQLQTYIDVTGVGGSTNGFTTTETNAPSAYWYDNRCANAALTSDPGWMAFTSAVPNPSVTACDTNFVNQFEGIRIMERGAKGQGLDGMPYTPGATAICQYGAVNTGNVNIPIYNYGAGKAYNQISNPYPSPVDIGTVITNAAASGAILGSMYYVWNPYLGSAGAYENIPVGTAYYLQPNSSFQVRAATSASVTPAYLHFTESNKSADVTDANGVLRDIPKFVTLSVLDANYHPYDNLYVSLDNGGTENEDNTLDAGKPVNPDVNFYSWSADQAKLSADVRPFVAGKTIQLGFYSDIAQTYIIKVAGSMAPAGGQCYLHDKLLNTMTLLEDGAEYTFSVTADMKSQGDQRFEIVMGATVVDAAAAAPLQVSMTPNPATDEVTLGFANAKTTNTTIRITDITGVCIYNTTIAQPQSGKVTISLDGVVAGVYMVELVSGDERTVERLVKE